MPRQSRIEYTGACFHVINRGNYRRDLFDAPGSAEAFERALFEACEAYHWRLHAFVIMRNHFHLALELGAPTLSLGMKWLQGTWSMRFNRFHRQIGRPFQGRFKAVHVQPGLRLAWIAHYVHLNPVRAKLVAGCDADKFRFSSLWHYCQPARPSCLVPSTLLNGAGGLTDTPEGWAAYRRYLKIYAEADDEERRKLYRSIRRGWCIGSDVFRAELRNRQISTIADTGRPPRNLTAQAWRADRENDWEQKLAAAARSFGIDLQSLPAKKSCPDKVRLAEYLRATTAVSNIWLAHRLQMGKPGSVSYYVHRLRVQRARLS